MDQGPPTLRDMAHAFLCAMLIAMVLGGVAEIRELHRSTGGAMVAQ